MGFDGFREAIAEYIGAVRGVRCDASQILVTTGSQQALQLASQVLLDPGDHAWIEEPGYHGARHALIDGRREAHHGAGKRRRPRRERGDSPRSASARRVHHALASISAGLHDECHAAHAAAQLGRAQAGAWILEDDYDSEYRFGERPIASCKVWIRPSA